MIAYLIFQFLLGISQIIHALYRTCKTKQPKPYYQDLKKYWCIVFGYFTIIILYTYIPIIPFRDYPLLRSIMFSLLMVITPLSIAIYYIYICRKPYYQEIEKLIF